MLHFPNSIPDIIDAFTSYGPKYCFIMLRDKNGLSMHRKGNIIKIKSINKRFRIPSIVIAPSPETDAFIGKLWTIDPILMDSLELIIQ